MNKRAKRLIIYLILISLLFIATSSPDIALRISVFFATPSSAFSMEYREIKHEEDYTLYRIDKNTPVDAATGNPLSEWVVYHCGPFNLATWNGEG